MTDNTSIAPSTIHIAILEDEEPMLLELCALVKEEPDMVLAGAYRKPEDALSFFIKKPKLDIVIVDIGLQARTTGIDVIRTLRAHFDQNPPVENEGRRVRFLVNTISENRDNVYPALRAGAEGYILKGDKQWHIAEAIRDLHAGGSPMSSKIARHLLKEFGPDAPPAAPAKGEENQSLTPREEEVLELVAQGWSNPMISEKLGITVGVVKLHCNSIYRKLHCRREDIIKQHNGNKPPGDENGAAQKPEGFWAALWAFFARRLRR